MHTTTADERQISDLAHRLGLLEAIGALAAALAEKLAGNPETTDDDIEGIRRIGLDAFRRRRAAKE